MTKRRRRALLGLSAAAVAATVTASLLTSAPTASADVGGPSLLNNKGADPHITRCTNPIDGHEGYCMVTSHDMTQADAYHPANYYPMEDTYLYYSATGTEWDFVKIVASESDIGTGGTEDWVPEGALHQWAPSLNQWGKHYYLYVPNVSDKSDEGIHTSSRIGVWKSPEHNAFGEYEYKGYIEEGENQYMSDPHVLVDGDVRWLVWADGAPVNCGGFKTAKMTNYHTIDPTTIKTVEFISAPAPSPKISDLGWCDVDGPPPGGPIPAIPRPYLEGASLYKFNNSKLPGPYTLIFPAKPDDHTPDDTEGGDNVPTECTTANGGPNTTNSVIAYATATNPQGPFTYRGIIMCGSTSEWTNQATISEVEAANGRTPWVIAYHDAVGDDPETDDVDEGKQRWVHGECLFTNNGRIAGVYRQEQDKPNGYNDCVNDVNYKFSALYVSDANIASNGRTMVLSAPNGGADPVKLSRYAVGPWERFELVEVDADDKIYAIKSLANGKYLCASLITSALKASCTSPTAFGATFTKQFIGTGVFTLWSEHLNEYLSMHSNKQLYADSDNGNDKAANFTELSQT